MLNSLLIFFTAFTAQALVMEPTFQAADSLGYQVVGEVEFPKNSTKVPASPMQRQIEEIGELCPRTQSYDPRISSSAKFVILAWSDHDYPTESRQIHSSYQQWIAQRRAASIADKIRKQVKGQMNFELVNMANRQPHLVESGQKPDEAKTRHDVKSILETAGAAPSTRLGFGLFAEFSQAAKAVIWVECKESFVRRRGPAPPVVQLAVHGAKNTELLGHF